MEKCEVRYSFWKNGVLALLFIFMSFGTALWMIDEPKAMSYFGVLMCLLGLYVFGSRTINPGPILIIDESGITDRRKWVGTIPWTEISSVKVRDYGRTASIEIGVQNPEKWQDKLPMLYRVYWKLFPKWKIISIPLQNVDTSLATISGAMRK